MTAIGHTVFQRSSQARYARSAGDGRRPVAATLTRRLTACPKDNRSGPATRTPRNLPAAARSHTTVSGLPDTPTQPGNPGWAARRVENECHAGNQRARLRQRPHTESPHGLTCHSRCCSRTREASAWGGLDGARHGGDLLFARFPDGWAPIRGSVHNVDGVLRGLGSLVCDGLHGGGRGLGQLTLAVQTRWAASK
jgi:hypothetical protein